MTASRPLPTGGTVRPITRWGTPVMHHRLAAVETFDDELKSLVADMVATMRAAPGVGLAANQIGVDRQVFVFECPDENEDVVTGVVCNPELLLPEGDDRRLEEADEGCLSLPGAFVACARPDTATVRGFDENGDEVEFVGTGLLSRCLQHETDHLHGTVFGDRISSRLRKKLYKQHESYADDYSEIWPAEA